MLSLNRIKSGIKDFDAAFYVEADSEAKMRDFLIHERHILFSDILELNNRNQIVCETKRDYMLLRLKNWMIDPARLKRVFDRFEELC